jgi:hypothetical protein
MSPEDWKILVRDAVQHVADEEYQRRSWFGLSPTECSSPDEVLQTFDDLDFSEFLASGEVNLTDQQRVAGKTLEAEMDRFAQATPIQPDPGLVINDERWIEIQSAAGKILEALSS